MDRSWDILAVNRRRGERLILSNADVQRLHLWSHGPTDPDRLFSGRFRASRVALLTFVHRAVVFGKTQLRTLTRQKRL